MDEFMKEAFKEAQKSMEEGGIPIGAVLVHKSKIIGRGHNKRIQNESSIQHGEMNALENAGRRSASVYKESVMYTTLSPCSMCSGAMILYGIPKVVIGENRNYTGAEEWLRSKGVDVVVLDDPECVEMMSGFIKNNPALWNEDIGQ